MGIFRFVFFFFLLLTYGECLAQETRDTTIPASTKFKISNGRTFWMGANYRKEWLTPIRVPIVDLSTQYGGLKPVKTGGGKQTKSLRVEDANGKEYNFRSIEKFITSKTLPADLQSEAAIDIVADGVSASYPYAALSIPVLAEAAGIPYLKSTVVFLPDDPLLGEYAKEYGNMLAYLEEKLPEGVKKGEDTEEVVEELREDNDNTVDQYALLKARILDMFVMDLDRHEGQWEWHAIKQEKGKKFVPIPKDRDQAFYINQGVLPHIAQWSWLVPQLEGLKVEAKNIKRFNYSARNLDRFFLNQLSEEDWVRATAEFLSAMTDAVIDSAMMRQPPEIRALSTAKIAATLKERRKYLAAEVLEYYRFLSEIVDITASDKKEIFDIARNDDGSVRVNVHQLNDEGQKGDTIYSRLFDAQDTKELRLYSFGGDDQFIVRGSNDKIKVRMIGGEGTDRFENAAESGGGGLVYDHKDENSEIIGKLKNKTSRDTIVNHYDMVYYKYNQVIPFIAAGYNQDDGILLGAYLKIIHHGFRKEPYKNSHTFTFRHALATQAFNVRYNAEFIGTFGRRSDLLFETDIKAPEITNFFGYGVNSIYDKEKPGRFRYYRARYNLGDITLSLRKNFSEKVFLTLGPTFQFFSLDPNDRRNANRFIVQTGENGLNPSTLFEKQSYFGGRFSFTADTRDNRILPRKGILWESSAKYLSGLNDASYELTQLNSEFTFHISLVKNFVVLVNRFGGGHNFGDFEFYQAQYLGTDAHLRGYRKYRFAGRSKVFNNAELRIRLANFKTYLFPGSLGIHGFYDTGRIWADEGDNDTWLSGYGAGFWISPLRRIVLTFTYAFSKEDRMPLIGLGWKL